MQLWMVNQASWFPCSFLNEGIRGIRLTNCWIQWPIHRADITMKINHSCRKICQGHGWYGLGVRETNIFHTFLVTFYVGHMHHWGVNDPSHTTSNWEDRARWKLRHGDHGLLGIGSWTVMEPLVVQSLTKVIPTSNLGVIFWDTNPKLNAFLFSGCKNLLQKLPHIHHSINFERTHSGREFEALK